MALKQFGRQNHFRAALGSGADQRFDTVDIGIHVVRKRLLKGGNVHLGHAPHIKP